jgi:hypothetical protein
LISEQLAKLNGAVTEHENDNGKTAAALVEAKHAVHNAMTVLHEAQRKLQELEAAGSALTKYANSVLQAERQYENIFGKYSDQVQRDVVRSWFGHDVSLQKISAERKNDLKLHVRVVNLQKLKHVGTDYPVSRHYQHGDSNQPGRIVGSAPTVENVNKKADVVGNKLTDLKAYIAQDQAAQAK